MSPTAILAMAVSLPLGEISLRYLSLGFGEISIRPTASAWQKFIYKDLASNFACNYKIG